MGGKERDNNTDKKVRNPPKDMKLDLDLLTSNIWIKRRENMGQKTEPKHEHGNEFNSKWWLISHNYGDAKQYLQIIKQGRMGLNNFIFQTGIMEWKRNENF